MPAHLFEPNESVIYAHGSTVLLPNEIKPIKLERGSEFIVLSRQFENGKFYYHVRSEQDKCEYIVPGTWLIRKSHD